jgi:hypothetical protein
MRSGAGALFRSYRRVPILDVGAEDDQRRREVRLDRVTDAANALDGLLRVAYQQGQRQIGWDDLCALCEDAVVAGGLNDGEMDPWAMQALVDGQSTALAEHLARQDSLGWQVSGDTDERSFSLLALLWSLHGLRGPRATERGAA